MKTHTDLRPFSCDYCELKFRDNSSRKKHIMIHTGEKPLKCPVAGCSAAFIEYGNRTRHLKTHR